MEKLKEIPSEIVFAILTWLPVKALDRFKCVSKSWSSIILQPEFVKSHRPSGCILLNIDISMKKGLFYASINVRGDSLRHEQIEDLKTETFVQRLSMPCFGYDNITPF
ncbi:hypothetical protein A4A49_36024 [Nicotiana attenuata]|uniref:F-box domain-containing protein n=1 Tax=Nicotiana attenuata TaxID=49451 RepID=A0A1J6L507_NICAT|nr:hypothetical protein A4A49_36024 [Nicotiana attenuata]